MFKHRNLKLTQTIQFIISKKCKHKKQLKQLQERFIKYLMKNKGILRNPRITEK